MKAGALEFRHHVKTTEYPTSATVAYSGGAGALPLTHPYIKYTSSGTEAVTVANGEEGQVLYIDAVSISSGTGTVGPASGTNATGWSDLALATVGDKAVLYYVDDTMGWIIISLLGTAAGAAPAFTNAT
jgi:hypothetical protein